MKNQKFLEKAIRFLPPLIETEAEAKRTVIIKREESGSPSRNFDGTSNIKKYVNSEGMGDPAPDKVPGEITGSIGGITIEETTPYTQQALKKGDRVIVDFGDHQVGYITFDFQTIGSHADAPVWLRLHFAEQPIELFEDAKSYCGWIASSWIEQEEIHVDVLPSVYKLSRRYAFRYLMIEVIDISSKFNLVINKITCTAVSSADDSKLLPYEADDQSLEELDRIAVRTLHNCMQTVFEDGPKRDRRLWMGDLRIQALCNYETYRLNDMVKACLYLFAALPMEEGKAGACLFLDPVPEVDDTDMFDYSLFFTDILYDYFMETNDHETLEELWDTAYRQIEIAAGQLDERGIVKDSNRLGWCFVDWNLALNKQAGAQGIFLYTIKRAAYMAAQLGKTEEKKNLNILYQKLKDSANRYLWDPAEKVYTSGEKRQVSFASQVWMVLGGAIEGEEAAELLKRISSKEDAVQMVTPYMYHNYIDAWITAGEKERALVEIKGYWGKMAEMGADTFFEMFNPANPQESPYGGTIVNSYCHAWSCGPAYFLRKYFRNEA